MILIIKNDNDNRWDNMCDWLNNHVPAILEASHRYIPDSDYIEIDFMYEVDAVAFKLKFEL